MNFNYSSSISLLVGKIELQHFAWEMVWRRKRFEWHQSIWWCSISFLSFFSVSVSLILCIGYLSLYFILFFFTITIWVFVSSIIHSSIHPYIIHHTSLIHPRARVPRGCRCAAGCVSCTTVCLRGCVGTCPPSPPTSPATPTAPPSSHRPARTSSDTSSRRSSSSPSWRSWRTWHASSTHRKRKRMRLFFLNFFLSYLVLFICFYYCCLFIDIVFFLSFFLVMTHLSNLSFCFSVNVISFSRMHKSIPFTVLLTTISCSKNFPKNSKKGHKKWFSKLSFVSTSKSPFLTFPLFSELYFFLSFFFYSFFFSFLFFSFLFFFFFFFYSFYNQIHINLFSLCFVLILSHISSAAWADQKAARRRLPRRWVHLLERNDPKYWRRNREDYPLCRFQDERAQETHRWGEQGIREEKRTWLTACYTTVQYTIKFFWVFVRCSRHCFLFVTIFLKLTAWSVIKKDEYCLHLRRTLKWWNLTLIKKEILSIKYS